MKLTVTRLGVAATLILLAVPLVMWAQQAGKVPRLCFLTFDPGTLQSTRFHAFFEGLRELGYVHGQTITIDYLSAASRAQRFPDLVAECLRLKVDIIAVTTTPAAQAAKNATRTVPIVILVGDPVATGLVDSLARPGGNITGLSYMLPGLAAKRLELLKETVPRITRVLILSYLVDPIAPPQIEALKNAARELGVKLQIREIRTADDLPAAFDAGVKEGAEGLLTTGESIFSVHRARVIELAARHRLPAVHISRLFANDTGLMAYSADSLALHRRAAIYVEKILKGARPADLPVEQPMKFELVINMKTAKALGLTIPPSLLLRADQVIE